MRQPPKLIELGAPAEEVITAAQLADWTGASATDPVLAALVISARQAAESYLGMTFVTRQWKQLYDLVRSPDDWWDGVREAPIAVLGAVPRAFPLARYPVTAVTEVAFFDEADVKTVAAATTYYLSTSARPPQVALRSGQVWPTPQYRIRDTVEITFTAGYANAAAVPQVIKDGVKALASYLFEHRGACTVEEAIKNSGAADFFRSYKVLHV